MTLPEDHKNNPCIDCLCKPVCKHKPYIRLMKCHLVYNFIYKRPYASEDNHYTRMKSLFNGLGITSLEQLGYKLRY